MDNVPIIIDNGSFECRAGYSVHEEPSLLFRNLVGRSRSRQKPSFVGEVDADCFLNAKSPFEQNVVTQIDLQETIFDHIFHNLKVDSVTNPIVFNEALFCPQKCRAQMSELLLEQYSVDKIAFFVDGISSHWYNYSKKSGQIPGETIMVSFGHQTTHIIPMTCHTDGSLISPTLIPAACRRLSIGGGHISWYLQQLLHLKYPCHIERITAAIAEQIAHSLCRVAENYRDEMSRWASDDGYRALNTSTWGLPYSDTSKQRANEIAERRQLQADRLRELRRKRMLEKSNAEDLVAVLAEKNAINCTEKLDSQGSLNKYSKVETTDVNITQNFEEENESDSKSTTTTTISDLETQSTVYPMTKTEPDTASNTRRLTDIYIPIRQKKSAELLVSLALPAAVQAQMTSVPVSFNLGLNEQRIRRRTLAAGDLEAKCVDDFPLWLTRLQHKRLRIMRQRTIRQSRIELATEFGFNSADSVAANGGTKPGDTDSVSSVRTWKNYRGKEETGHTSSSGTLSMDPASGVASRAGVLSERRQRQLEKIRAMTAELKSEREYNTVKRSEKTVAPSKNAKGKQNKEKALKKSANKLEGYAPIPSVDAASVNSLGVDGLDAVEETMGVDSLDAIPSELTNEDSQLPGLDDELEVNDLFDVTDLKGRRGLNLPPASPNSVVPFQIDKNDGKKFLKDNFDLLDDASDVSEGERDQLAVIDSVRAVYDPDFIKEAGTAGLKVDLSEFYQIHIGSETLRATETFFERSLLGSNQVGIGECLSWVLKDSSREVFPGDVCSPWIPKRLFLTGGPARLPGMKDRIILELTQLLPWCPEGNSIDVVMAANPSLDAWHGARLWSIDAVERDNLGFTTRKDYEECGLDYLIENAISNSFFGSTKQLHAKLKSTQPRFRP